MAMPANDPRRSWDGGHDGRPPPRYRVDRVARRVNDPGLSVAIPGVSLLLHGAFCLNPGMCLLRPRRTHVVA
jgi:hypothetical protein